MTLPKNVDDLYPLTPMQHLMLLHAISVPGNGVLFNQVCYDVRGALDADAFRRAWEGLVARHGALRTAFLWEGLPQPLQVVRSVVELPFRVVDVAPLPEDERLAAVESLRREDLETPLHLGKAPLMRATLVRLGDDRHRFFWAIHHLVVDRWSHGVLFADLRALYSASVTGQLPALPPAPSFRSYVAWVSQQDRAGAERFWRAELAGLRTATPLGSAGRVAGRGPRRLATHHLSPATTRAIRALASHWRSTPATIFLAATALLLAARTGRDDVLCGVTVSGRPPELEDAGGAVGSFVNNLPARLPVARASAVDVWIRELQRAQGKRQAFAHVSLVDIHTWSDLAPSDTLFDLLLLLNLTDESDGEWPGFALHAGSATLDAGYPFVLSVGGVGEEYVLTLVHDDTFLGAEMLLAEFAALATRLANAREGARVGDLLPPPRTPAERPAERAPRHAPTTGRDGRSVGDAMADALLMAWRDVLGTPEIGLDDDFFVLGGTSLQAAQLFARVERIVGRTLPLSTLFTAGSVRALLEAVDRPQRRTESLVRIRSSGERIPVHAIPGINGNVVGLAGLAREMGPDHPFSAFESPGLDGREAPLTSIEAIADRYVAELVRDEAGSVHLLGICWGAAVAFEMARRLRARGRPPESLVLLDPAVLLRASAADGARGMGGGNADFIRRRLELYWDEFREGDWRERSRFLAQKARRAATMLARGDARDASVVEMYQARVREANTLAVTRYAPGRYAGRAVLLLTSDRNVGAGADPRLEWRALIDPPPDVVSIAGVDSGDAIAPANVGGFAQHLRTWMERVRANP